MKISELHPDKKNANKGTVRGSAAIKESLSRYGAGRSILIDRDGNIIAGNKTAANAQAAGLEDVVVIPTDGSKLVAVQRTDLDISDPKARELAIADNRAAELSLAWDGPTLAEFADDLDLKPFFTDKELSSIVAPHVEAESDSESGAEEIDVDAFSMQCKCPRCGFEFDPPESK